MEANSNVKPDTPRNTSANIDLLKKRAQQSLQGNVNAERNQDGRRLLGDNPSGSVRSDTSVRVTAQHLERCLTTSLARGNTEGYDHLIRTRQDRRFPVPADLIAALHGTYEDAAVLGWNTAFRSILSHPGRHLEFEDPLIAETIRELGGVNFLSGMTQKDIPVPTEALHQYLHMILAKKGKQDYDPVCKGQYQTATNRPVYIGKNQPRLIEEAQVDECTTILRRYMQETYNIIERRSLPSVYTTVM